MAPLIKYLRKTGVSRAVLIPSGFLRFFPLHASWMRDEVDSWRRYASDSVHLSYSPSAQALSSARTRLQTLEDSDDILCVSLPLDSSQESLAYSQKEVQSAVEHFSKCQALADASATKENVLSNIEKHSVLHFSCHGKANILQPLNNGLLLSANEVLTMRDFLEQSLASTRLVVLSACETGISGVELTQMKLLILRLVFYRLVY